MKSLAEVPQSDGSTRWELVEMDESARQKAEIPVEEKPTRARKVSLEPSSFESPSADY